MHCFSKGLYKCRISGVITVMYGQCFSLLSWSTLCSCHLLTLSWLSCWFSMATRSPDYIIIHWFHHCLWIKGCLTLTLTIALSLDLSACTCLKWLWPIARILIAFVIPFSGLLYPGEDPCLISGPYPLLLLQTFLAVCQMVTTGNPTGKVYT